jgi:hypothetical protein
MQPQAPEFAADSLLEQRRFELSVPPRGVGTCSDFSQRVGDLNVTPQEPRGLRILDGRPSVGEDLRRSPALHGRCPQPRFWRSMYVARLCVPPGREYLMRSPWADKRMPFVPGRLRPMPSATRASKAGQTGVGGAGSESTDALPPILESCGLAPWQIAAAHVHRIASAAYRSR